MSLFRAAMSSMNDICSLLLDNEIISLEATVGGRSEVLAQVLQLRVLLHLEEEHAEGDADETHQNLSVNVHLGTNVGRVIETMSSTEETVLVEATHEEGVLTGQAEGPELVLVVYETHWSLSEGTLGCLGQVCSIDFRCSEKFNVTFGLFRVLS